MNIKPLYLAAIPAGLAAAYVLYRRSKQDEGMVPGPDGTIPASAYSAMPVDASAYPGTIPGGGGGGYYVPAGASTSIPQGTPLVDATQPIVTRATSLEPAMTLRVVHPRKQPKAPKDGGTKAKSLAPSLSAMLVANAEGPEYAKKNLGLINAVKAFQGSVGLVEDGLYGPQTAGALAFYLKSAPPPPFFYGVGERVVAVYAPQ